MGGEVAGGDGCGGGARLALAPSIRIIARSTLVHGTSGTDCAVSYSPWV